MGIDDRLTKLRRMLKARTQGGEPLKNYGENVAAIRAEIARLEAPPPKSKKKAAAS